MTQTLIAVADKQNIYRRGLMLSLKDENDLKVTIETDNGLDLIRRLKKSPVDVLILDTQTEGLGGYETVLILKKKFPELNIIMLSQTEAYFSMLEYFKIGVKAFLLKDISKSTIIKAINKVKKGEYYFGPHIPAHTRNLIINKQFKPNTDFNEREIEIIKLICEEKTNQDIADIMCLSRRTIEWHRRSIQSKMEVKTPIGIFKYAISHQLYRV